LGIFFLLMTYFLFLSYNLLMQMYASNKGSEINFNY
jgi:hypothetical protein